MSSPGKRWSERMLAEEPEARKKWPTGAVYKPHGKGQSDANLFYADLLAEPDPADDPTRSTAPKGEPETAADADDAAEESAT